MRAAAQLRKVGAVEVLCAAARVEIADAQIESVGASAQRGKEGVAVPRGGQQFWD